MTINRYFIALIPTPTIAGELIELKNYFWDRFQSRASLNSPPHVTLHMPFEWKAEREKELELSIKAFARNKNSFQIALDGFGCFEPRVIFVNVLDNPVLMIHQKELHRHCKINLNIFNALYQDKPFHPHITLAFRDLKKNAFQVAWDEFSKKQFKGRFDAEKLSILKHDGKNWEVFAEAPMNVEARPH